MTLSDIFIFGAHQLLCNTKLPLLQSSVPLAATQSGGDPLRVLKPQGGRGERGCSCSNFNVQNLYQRNILYRIDVLMQCFFSSCTIAHLIIPFPFSIHPK